MGRELRIRVLEARDLCHRDGTPTLNPFVCVKVGGNKQLTDIKRGGGPRPTWNKDFVFPLATVSDAVTLEVFDEHPSLRTISVGDSMNISLRKLQDGSMLDCGIHIFLNGTLTGEVHLQMQMRIEPVEVPPVLSKTGKTVSITLRDNHSLVMGTLLSGSIQAVMQLGQEKLSSPFLIQIEDRQRVANFKFSLPSTAHIVPVQVMAVEVWCVPDDDESQRTLVGFNTAIPPFTTLLTRGSETIGFDLFDGGRNRVGKMTLFGEQEGHGNDAIAEVPFVKRPSTASTATHTSTPRNKPLANSKLEKANIENQPPSTPNTSISRAGPSLASNSTAHSTGTSTQSVLAKPPTIVSMPTPPPFTFTPKKMQGDVNLKTTEDGAGDTELAALRQEMAGMRRLLEEALTLLAQTNSRVEALESLVAAHSLSIIPDIPSPISLPLSKAPRALQSPDGWKTPRRNQEALPEGLKTNSSGKQFGYLVERGRFATDANLGKWANC